MHLDKLFERKQTSNELSVDTCTLCSKNVVIGMNSLKKRNKETSIMQVTLM